MTLNQKIEAFQKGEFSFLPLRDEITLLVYQQLTKTRWRYTEDEISSCICFLMENLNTFLSRYKVSAVPFENYIMKTSTLFIMQSRRQSRHKLTRESVYLQLQKEEISFQIKEPESNYKELEGDFIQAVKGTMNRVMKKTKPHDYRYRLTLLLLLLKSGYYLTEGEKEQICQWGDFHRQTIDEYLSKLFLKNEGIRKKYDLYQIRRNRYATYLLEPNLRPASENLNYNIIQERLESWNKKLNSINKAPKNHQLADLLNIDLQFVNLIFSRLRREHKRVCVQY